MKNFYIFLDIDGVMYDWDWVICEVNAGKMKRGEFNNKFKPQSIMALNYLIKQLEKKYNVKLVISSTWRANMPHTIKTLKNNGLVYNEKFERTPIYDPALRGEQILDYLKDKQNYNFVIIDDELFNFKKFFKTENIIKCDMFHQALSLKMVKEFLIKLNELEK